MESDKNLQREKLNVSLNKLLNLFDEGESLLKGDSLPDSAIEHKSYNLSPLVEKILDPNIKFEKSIEDEPSTNNLITSKSQDKPNMACAFEALRKRVGTTNNSTSNNELEVKKDYLKNGDPKVQPTLFKIPTEDNFIIKYFTNDFSETYFATTNQYHNNFNNDVNDINSLNYSQLQSKAKLCQNCDACKIRKNTIFGEGELTSRLLVVGEGPGEYEDNSGQIFVGPSGQFLEKWLKGITLDMRRDVYLTNIVKCYSGNNPTKNMVLSCKNYLKREIQLVNPKAILVLGKVAAFGLIEKDLTLSELRNRPIYYNGIPVVVTYHPSAVLRNPKEWKRPAWEDVKKVANLLNISVPKKNRSK